MTVREAKVSWPTIVKMGPQGSDAARNVFGVAREVSAKFNSPVWTSWFFYVNGSISRSLFLASN
jgi:hypothetical protein